MSSAQAGTGPRLRVVVADDEDDARGLLRIVLEASGDIQVVAEAADGPAAVRLSSELRPGAVVSDLRMPGMTGDVALRTLRSLLPESVLVLCSAEPTDVAIEVARADAVVDKRHPGWPYEVAETLVEGAARLGPRDWPRWERRRQERNSRP